MKNLLNCHCIGLHSFPIELKDGYYKRIFFADSNHELWESIKLAIHPHHVDIKITIIDGELYNPLYEINKDGELFKKFVWNSFILNGKGGFEYLGIEHLKQVSNIKYCSGQSVVMKACELHTVQVEKGKKCVWLIEESVPTCDYFPINYSNNDLWNWNTNGLYIECSEDTKQKMIGKYIKDLFLCDTCGNTKYGKQFPVYNENHVRQKGLIKCEDCLIQES